MQKLLKNIKNLAFEVGKMGLYQTGYLEITNSLENVKDDLFSNIKSLIAKAFLYLFTLSLILLGIVFFMGFCFLKLTEYYSYSTSALICSISLFLVGFISAFIAKLLKS